MWCCLEEMRKTPKRLDSDLQLLLLLLVFKISAEDSCRRHWHYSSLMWQKGRYRLPLSSDESRSVSRAHHDFNIRTTCPGLRCQQIRDRLLSLHRQVLSYVLQLCLSKSRFSLLKNLQNGCSMAKRNYVSNSSITLRNSEVVPDELEWYGCHVCLANQTSSHESSQGNHINCHDSYSGDFGRCEVALCHVSANHRCRSELFCALSYILAGFSGRLKLVPLLDLGVSMSYMLYKDR